MSECGSCPTFSIIGESRTVFMRTPEPNGEDNKITKGIQRFNFWSGGYKIHDKGTDTQPLVLRGTETGHCADDGGICFDEDLCFPICFNMPLMNRFKFLMNMSDDNEEVTISGLGDCMNATYVIKHFNYTTDAPRAYSWTMTLEKVR